MQFLKRLLAMTSVGSLLLMACSPKTQSVADLRNENPNTIMNPTKSFYDFSATTIDGKTINMSQYKGKKVLIVNTASKCGYTPQYKGLEELHQKMGDKLIILGFPSNQFMAQEPGDNKDIAAFCQRNYGVSFQMFEKIDVKKGKDQHPLYEFLSHKALNGWNDNDPTWNFYKYLIDENGKLTNTFASGVEPMSQEILNAIQ